MTSYCTKFTVVLTREYIYLVLYCIISIHLYSASCSAHQSEALPVREAQREEIVGAGDHKTSRDCCIIVILRREELLFGIAPCLP